MIERIVLPLLCMFFLMGCSTDSFVKLRQATMDRSTLDAKSTLQLGLFSAAGLNPDRLGVAQPVTVRILQLRRGGVLQAHGYDALYDQEKLPLVLANDLVALDTFIFAPEENRLATLKIVPGTTTIAIMAMFRLWKDAQWQAEVLLPEDGVKGSTNGQTYALQMHFIQSQVVPCVRRDTPFFGAFKKANPSIAACDDLRPALQRAYLDAQRKSVSAKQNSSMTKQ